MLRVLIAIALLAAAPAYAGRPMHYEVSEPVTPPIDPPPTVGYGDYACGTSTNNWCIQTNGWTKITATTGSDALTCGTNTNDTCIIAVSATGVDGTCALQKATPGFTTEDLAAFSPSTACLSPQTAQGKLRTGKPDWIVFKKGDTFGPLNGPTSGNVQRNGKSMAEPMVFTAYGTGARPILQRTTFSMPDIINVQANLGQNTAFIGLQLYDSLNDPNSANWAAATIVGNTGTANGCATNTEICNISGGTPAKIQANPTRYYVFGTGIYSGGDKQLGAAVTSATASTIVFSAVTVPTAVRGVGVTFQLEDYLIGIKGYTSSVNNRFLLFEDNKLDYALFSETGDQNTAGVTNFFIRRNMVSNASGPTNAGYNGACFFSGLHYVYEGEYWFDENACNWGGFRPTRWSGGEFGQTHDLYLHDPSVGYNLDRNILANGSATGVQHRSATRAYNNLVIGQPNSWSHNVRENNFTASYNVTTNGIHENHGFRTAICAAPPCNSGTTISFEGLAVWAGQNDGDNAYELRNLTNPGSVVGVFNPGTSVLSAKTATLLGGGFGTAGLFPGVRGDGVKTGDILELMATKMWGSLISRGGTYLSNGPAFQPNDLEQYLGPTTVSVTAASPAVVTELGAANSVRSTDEPFKFTAGTLPTGLTIGTVYCSFNVSGNTYNVYLATGGLCPGGGTAINTTGSNQTGISREGSRKFLFTTGAPFAQPVPFAGVPSWVTVGTRIVLGGICGISDSGSPFANQTNTVAYIAPASGGNIPYLITTNPILFTVSGHDNAQTSFIFGDIGQAQLASIRFGPNNVFTRGINNIGATSGLFAISAQGCAWGVDASGNYIYNWSTASTNDNLFDISGGEVGKADVVPPGRAAYLASNRMSSSDMVLNAIDTSVIGAAIPRLEAMIEAYDANLRGTTFTGTIAAAVGPATGSVVTITSGTPPLAGDLIFDASGSNPLPWATQAPPGQTIGSTFYIDKNITKGTAFAMKSGSSDHFMALALSQSKETGWNPAYAANAANNFIRNAIGCTAASTPACPPQ